MTRKLPAGKQPPSRDEWAAWLLEDRFGRDPEIRVSVERSLRLWTENLLKAASIAPGETVLDAGTGDGLLGFRALEAIGPQGRVIFNDVSETLLDHCRARAESLGVTDRCEFLRASIENLSWVPDATVNVVTTRSVLMHLDARAQALREIHRVLAPGGRAAIFEAIHRLSNRSSEHTFWGYDLSPATENTSLLRRLLPQIQPGADDPMANFDERDLLALAEHAGFSEIHCELHTRVLHPSPMRNWDFFFNTSRHPNYPALREAAAQRLTPEETERLIGLLRPIVESGAGIQRETVAYLTAVKANSVPSGA